MSGMSDSCKFFQCFDWNDDQLVCRIVVPKELTLPGAFGDFSQKFNFYRPYPIYGSPTFECDAGINSDNRTIDDAFLTNTVFLGTIEKSESHRVTGVQAILKFEANGEAAARISEVSLRRRVGMENSKSRPFYRETSWYFSKGLEQWFSGLHEIIFKVTILEGEFEVREKDGWIRVNKFLDILVPPLEVKQTLTTCKPSWKYYFLSQELSDIELCVQNQIFACHRLLLAGCSEVFARMFHHTNTKESLTRRVDILGVEAHIMREVLQYIYTGTSDAMEKGDVEVVKAIYGTADRYLIGDLKTRALEVIGHSITENNVESVWDFAEFHSSKELTEAVVAFCWRNRSLISVVGGSLQKLAKKCFPQLAKLCKSSDCYCKDQMQP